MHYRDLVLREAMDNRADRAEIFQRYLDERLFDGSISDATFVDGLWARQRALEEACKRLIALLEEA